MPGTRRTNRVKMKPGTAVMQSSYWDKIVCALLLKQNYRELCSFTALHSSLQGRCLQQFEIQTASS